jgi:hypothetical protein
MTVRRHQLVSDIVDGEVILQSGQYVSSSRDMGMRHANAIQIDDVVDQIQSLEHIGEGPYSLSNYFSNTLNLAFEFCSWL